MARFFGNVGYGISTEIRPGVWDDVIIEQSYFGDVILNSRQLVADQKVNDDISVQNSISIVADAYADENFFAIRYVSWAGTLWRVTNVQVQRPRLLLTLGGVYDGPTPAASDTP